ncbi:MAG: BatD family protein [Dysgonamonadaceae bacterium]|jgi:hypothetical protein|nr:BatD family protein [Dysgonamonadaceae bacterium]
MKRSIIIVLFLALFTGGFAQVSFKGSAPSTVVVNQNFKITYQLTTHGDEGKNIRLPEPNGLNVKFGPTLSGQNSFTSIVNGNTTTQVVSIYTYVLNATNEGTYTIPAATIKVGNSEYKSNELKIKVLPPDKAAAANANTQSQSAQPSGSQGVSDNDIFMRAIVSKTSAYENEGVLVTFKIYSKLDYQLTSNGDFPNFEGFVVQDIELPPITELRTERYEGRNYSVAVIKQAVLYPQRSGKITIDRAKYEVVIPVKGQSRSIDDFLNNPFGALSVKKNLVAPAVTVDVRSLPAGKPAAFSGALGDYRITSSINATQLKANEPVTVKVTISGNGNIKLIKNPEITFPPEFEVYDPKVDVNTNVSSSGVSGSKTIEYYAIPRHAGDFTIPAAQFAYFDVKSGTYKTLSTEVYQLHVLPGEAGSGASTVVNSANKEDIRYLNQDIRHIKLSGFSFHQSEFLFGTLVYWLWYLIPAALFIACFIYFRKQIKQNANLALMRTKKANQVASRRLKMAGKYLKEGKKDSFYEELLKAVWGYLSDKLNIPVSSLTKDNAAAELTQYGAKAELIEQFRHILDRAEFAQYAPSEGQGAMDELYQETIEAINNMEKL